MTDDERFHRFHKRPDGSYCCEPDPAYRDEDEDGVSEDMTVHAHIWVSEPSWEHISKLLHAEPGVIQVDYMERQST